MGQFVDGGEIPARQALANLCAGSCKVPGKLPKQLQQQGSVATEALQGFGQGEARQIG